MRDSRTLLMPGRPATPPQPAQTPEARPLRQNGNSGKCANTTAGRVFTRCLHALDASGGGDLIRHCRGRAYVDFEGVYTGSACKQMQADVNRCKHSRRGGPTTTAPNGKPVGRSGPLVGSVVLTVQGVGARGGEALAGMELCEVGLTQSAEGGATMYGAPRIVSAFVEMGVAVIWLARPALGAETAASRMVRLSGDSPSPDQVYTYCCELV